MYIHDTQKPMLEVLISQIDKGAQKYFFTRVYIGIINIHIAYWFICKGDSLIPNIVIKISRPYFYPQKQEMIDKTLPLISERPVFGFSIS